MQPIVNVLKIGKQYRIGKYGVTSLGEELRQLCNKVWKRARPWGGLALSPKNDQEFWALRDVSFAVGKGEIIGILGSNGAGKSTLLKLLARITEPTEGEIIIRGRMASLLEVGTGFHPELTGRENVFLNGAILGMQRAEIEAKYEAIVKFAEVEKFIDTPVKRYSSGMYVRLAFSVAAHLEPDILIVDEVLAVGDYSFQAKCIERMRGLTKIGRTILFVSHNFYTLQTLCERGLLLSRGRLVADGKLERIIAEQRKMSSTQEKRASSIRGGNLSQVVCLLKVLINGRPERSLECAGRLRVEIFCELKIAKAVIVNFGCSIKSVDGTYISGVSTFVEARPRLYESGLHHVGVILEGLNLCSGGYKMAFAVSNESGVATFFADDDFAEITVVRPFEFDGAVGVDHCWVRLGV